MSRVTSKLQVTVPKKLAEKHGIRPGSEIFFESATDGLRVRVPNSLRQERLTFDERLRLFDEATRRQTQRNRRLTGKNAPSDRGWKRTDLYRRGMAV